MDPWLGIPQSRNAARACIWWSLSKAAALMTKLFYTSDVLGGPSDAASQSFIGTNMVRQHHIEADRKSSDTGTPSKFIGQQHRIVRLPNTK
jgi:hypothetical protein